MGAALDLIAFESAAHDLRARALGARRLALVLVGGGGSHDLRALALTVEPAPQPSAPVETVGSATLTVDAAAVASSGSVVVAGALSSGLEAASVAGAGAVLVEASATLALDATGASGAGAVAVLGAGTGVAGAGASGAGAVAISGAIASTLAGDTIIAAGDVIALPSAARTAVASGETRVADAVLEARSTSIRPETRMAEAA